MKKKAIVFTGGSFLLLSLWWNGSLDNSNRDDLAANTSTKSNSSKNKKNSKYKPSLPQASAAVSSKSSAKTLEIRSTKSLKGITEGNSPGQIGVSKDGDHSGPAAFVYLKNLKSFAILDSENGRINIYSTDGKSSSSIDLDPNQRGLGMAVNAEGDLNMLSRRANSAGGFTPGKFEITSIDPVSFKKTVIQRFSFTGSEETNGTVGALDMQIMGNYAIIRGNGENENHSLDLSKTLDPRSETDAKYYNATTRIPGQPLDESLTRFVRIAGDLTDSTNMTFEIVDENSTVQTKLVTPGDITDIRSVKVADKNHILVETENDSHNVTLYSINDSKINNEATAKLEASSENVSLEHDLHNDGFSVYQSVRDDKSKTWGVSETKFKVQR